MCYILLCRFEFFSARLYEAKSLDKNVPHHCRFFLQLQSYTSAQSSWFMFWFMSWTIFFFWFMYPLDSLMDRKKNVHWMSLSRTNWMSSVRKNLSPYKMSYTACHSCICQAETILSAGICISRKNEINVLKLTLELYIFCSSSNVTLSRTNGKKIRG